MLYNENTGRRLTLDELRSERDELVGEASELIDRAGDSDLEGDDAHRYRQIETRLDTLRAEGRSIEDRIEQAKRIAAEHPERLENGTGDSSQPDWHSPHRTTRTTDDRGSSLRDNAMRTLDRSTKDGQLPAHSAEKVEHLLKVGSQQDQSVTARWAVATGDPSYRSAFAKMLSDPDKGHLLWSREEHAAYQRVAHVQSEQRYGMADGTGSLGGYMLPIDLDPAILLTSAGSNNPLRRISRVVQTMTNSWQGVSSAGVTAEWVGEGVEVADATPTLGQPVVPVWKGDSFVPYSFEIGMDGLNFLQELQKLLIDAADQLQATAFTTGSGTGQPKGIITSLVAASPSVVVTGSGSEALVSADVYALQNQLPPRFQPDAQWTASLPIVNQLRQFETTNGSIKFPELRDVPPYLLGRALNENSNMDSVINPVATENNYSIVYGDFDEFLIVDRVGSSIEILPHLLGANRRPTLQRGALLWFRTGSDALVPNAFRLLNVPTTSP